MKPSGRVAVGLCKKLAQLCKLSSPNYTGRNSNIALCGIRISIYFDLLYLLFLGRYFTPSPNFYYMDDKSGIICRVVLPPNAALRQVDSEPCFSRDMARRNACLKACQMLHNLGALTDYLLPDVASKRKGSTMHSSELKSHEGMFSP